MKDYPCTLGVWNLWRKSILQPENTYGTSTQNFPMAAMRACNQTARN